MRRIAALLAPVAILAGGACRAGGALTPAGPSARSIANLWWLMLAIGGAVWAVVAGLLVVAARRRRPSTSKLAGPALVVAGGIVLPAAVLVPLSAYVVSVSADLSHEAGDRDVSVEVTGHQYWWEVRYPDGGAVTANEVHVPTGRPVSLTLRSADVIHSFWVPEVHGKVDLIPGLETKLRFEIEHPGTYRGACAEFCGVQHAGMRLVLVAHRPDDFQTWLSAETNDAPAPSDEAEQRGLDTFLTIGCAECHQVRGTAATGRIGPDLTHLARRSTIGAGLLPNTRGNLGGWVLDAPAQKPGVLMPPQPVPPDELAALLDYLESLR